MERMERTWTRKAEELASRDQVIVLPGVTWEQYVDLSDARGELSEPRMAYLDGELELVSPSDRHELDKTLLARLLEAYAGVNRISLIGVGQTTWRKKARKAGAEADESYWIGRRKKAPDLAIEVICTSGGIDKREVYRRLGVPEVWFWIDGRLRIYRPLEDDGEHARSKLLPQLDLHELSRIIRSADVERQTEIVEQYRRKLVRRRG